MEEAWGMLLEMCEGSARRHASPLSWSLFLLVNWDSRSTLMLLHAALVEIVAGAAGVRDLALDTALYVQNKQIASIATHDR